MAGFVSVSNLRKSFGNFWAIDGVSFEIEQGELLVLLGPSGCGKTTTLRCIGGLERPDAGRIVIDGQDVTNIDGEGGIFLPPETRGMGMVAQSYAIWPHMTVFENVAFPLRMRKEKAALIRERVDWALDVVKLGGFGDRNATDLSGGQQQRVALARAIVAKPKVLLFDEPLSNLDAKLREQMRYLIKEIQREIRITAVYVTHDQVEAMGLGDELIVMNSGRIEQRGNARSLYSNPATRFVADFIGLANLIEGRMVESASSDGGLVAIRLGESDDGPVVRCRPSGVVPAENASLLARPEWLTIGTGASASTDNAVEGRVVHSQFLGEHTELIVATSVGKLRVTADGSTDFAEGDDVFLVFDPAKCVVLPSRSVAGDARSEQANVPKISQTV